MAPYSWHGLFMSHNWVITDLVQVRFSKGLGLGNVVDYVVRN